ncbi:phospholipase D family protein [Aestuariivirga sp.]|uniref:phospholipase D family protein n=1 Tax=Aestuariivirga sp. TaxID=2650926 RepID=UPI0039E44804
MAMFLTYLIGVIALLALGVAALRLAFPLPAREDGPPLTALPASNTTRLGRHIADRQARHPRKTGIHALASAPDAFSVRILLARAAEASIDIQIYIWRRDLTGLLMLREIHAAAERGVRVRLLIDDSGTRDLDTDLAALNAHPMIHVRLFNPRTIRWPLWLGYLIAPVRTNRRMHNKSFTVDGVASVVGGRNIGDEYFGAGRGSLFEDLDVLACGTVVKDIATDFDRYWDSKSSYPVAPLLTQRPGALPRLLADADAAARDHNARAYLEETRGSAIIDDLVAGSLDLEWTDARLSSDDPLKGLGLARRKQLMLAEMMHVLRSPRQSLDLVSAYFIPGKQGSRALMSLARGGVKIRVLTNAQELTDVLAVHAGYVKYRARLLRAGIKLYELKSAVRRSKQERGFHVLGSSGASLHAKTFAVDGQRVFVGSFNFDPRSALLNCEMGLLIESEKLAKQVTAFFDINAPIASYEVFLRRRHRFGWIETGPDGQRLISKVEPNTTTFRRLIVTMIGWLPVEWML